MNDIVLVKKLHEDAVLPKQATDSDAGYDLVAIDDGTVSEDGYIQYKTGISIEPPAGYHTEIFPRSSISKYDLVLANSIGLVDYGYRGEILVRFKHVKSFCEEQTTSCVALSECKSLIRKYKKGDRIAQLVIRKTERAQFEWAEEINQTERGDRGFGSSSR